MQYPATAIFKHEAGCPYRPQQCIYCGASMPASELMGHENGCEERYEVCKYCWRAARATCQSLRPVLLARCRISHLSMCSTPLLAMKVRLRDLDEHERRQCADRPVECQHCQRAFVQLALLAHNNPWLPRSCATHCTHAACFVCCLLHACYAAHPTLHAASRTLHATRISAAWWAGARQRCKCPASLPG